MVLGVCRPTRVYLPAFCLVLILAACQSGAEPADDTSADSTALPPSTTTPPPTTAAQADTTSTAAPTTTLAPTTTQPETSRRQLGFVEPFNLIIPASWSRFEESTQEILYIEAGLNILVFAVSDRATVDEWRDYLTGHEGLIVSEPTPAEVGGAEGFTTEVRLGPDATESGCRGQGRCVPILGGSPGWVIVNGFPNQVWVVDVNGRPVFVAAEASESSFDAFVASVEEALSTLNWGSEA